MEVAAKKGKMRKGKTKKVNSKTGRNHNRRG